ncbi:phosphoribosylglycinamide formyltransferase [Roseivirga sp. UBA1976]|jgi:phosphoribosylglycinamide formyltransferase-1|uniref:phosphoribosylglycinamide formyltransferase n=1 Tax=Roseivirga sp. UBA1976 TaxID=1947386 RepID=UPI00257A52EF|nr:phosphoribosylglycinamide formyltransferase [Roseivirga sp. UBA1976]MEC7755981.1 phosphoribosylglycinamide formyltransferase [Bacteroidota bacterium]|tara:strand:+ start:9798 stop:10376 length:579 start_codon:yes stop_codon:yes gene_type:complete
MTKKRLSIFASGSGSNAEKFFEHFQNHPQIEIASVFTNNKSAGVIERAQRFNIKHHVYNRSFWQTGETIVEVLESEKIDFIVLAGFMLLIPKALVARFPNRIFNIHPALLPKFGGQGMYGMNVHKAVKAAGETETGLTIHYVNEYYDEGAIIFQESCTINPTDSAEEIAAKVLRLEHKNYPKVVEQEVLKSI